MYKICKSEQSVLRQRQMERQLLTMMGTLRFEEISVSDLCNQAGFSRKSFYRYFSGKEGALYALIDHTLWELESYPFTENWSDKNTYREKTVWFLQFWKNQRPLLDALDNSGFSELLSQRIIEYAKSRPGGIRRFLPGANEEFLEYATTFGIYGIMSIVYSWHRSGYLQTPEQIADIAVNLLTRPFIGTKKTDG